MVDAPAEPGATINDDTFVYRVVPRARFYAHLDGSSNLLPHPMSWEDPLDGFVFNTKLSDSSDRWKALRFSPANVFCQCWTLAKRSDAMWRIYSPNTDSLRIRTTVGVLRDKTQELLKGRMRAEVFVRPVKYVTDMELATRFSRLMNPAVEPILAEGPEERSDLERIAQMLLIKRLVFKHENEVRLIVAIPGAPLTEKTLVKEIGGNRFLDLGFKAASYIDQVFVDPRVPPPLAEVEKEIIRKRASFLNRLDNPKSRVMRSMLYAKPTSIEGGIEEIRRRAARIKRREVD
ncbi:MAG: DUF2971 domain-containing protein [bacterium]